MKLASLFRREPAPALSYDRDRLEPVIRCSICNGEQTAGFRNRQTGRFEEARHCSRAMVGESGLETC